MPDISTVGDELPAEIAALVGRLRALVRNRHRDLQEHVKWGSPTFSGYEDVCSVVAHRDHVNLQFFHGVELPRGRRGLRGTGRRMRHLRFYPDRPVDEEAIIHYLDAACDRDRAPALEGRRDFREHAAEDVPADEGDSSRKLDAVGRQLRS